MQKKIKSPVCFLIFTAAIFVITFLCITLMNAHSSAKTKDASLQPTLTVIIDAGHGGEDGGAIGNKTVYEKDLNLSIALKIGERLEKSGISTVYSRTEDILLYDRNVDYTNRKKALD